MYMLTVVIFLSCSSSRNFIISPRVPLSQIRFGFSALLFNSLSNYKEIESHTMNKHVEMNFAEKLITSCGEELWSFRARYGVSMASNDFLIAGFSGVFSSPSTIVTSAMMSSVKMTSSVPMSQCRLRKSSEYLRMYPPSRDKARTDFLANSFAIS